MVTRSNPLAALVKAVILAAILGVAGIPTAPAQQSAPATGEPILSEESVDASFLGGDSIFARAWNGGVVVFSVLAILVFFSVVSWAVLVGKLLYLRRVSSSSDKFIKQFWDSRSLNDLNGRLKQFPYSPVKEVFRTGYTELIRSSHLKDQAVKPELAVSAGVENLERSLVKAKGLERKKMESYLTFLAIVASASPFIGLFGTVWGIMNAFEGIAATGNASLAAVAPGISEALIATAFGLGAAIPAVMGYNLARARLGKISAVIDGFMADFLNIVERHLVTDKGRGDNSPSPM